MFSLKKKYIYFFIFIFFNKNKIFSYNDDLDSLLQNRDDQFYIKKIIIEGIYHNDFDFILNLSNIKIGDRIKKKDLSSAIKNIYKQNTVEDVSVFLEKNDDGFFTVIFKIKELKKVSKFEILGIPDDLKNDILEILKKKENCFFSINDIEDIKTLINDFLKKREIILKELKYKIKNVDDNFSVVIFKIDVLKSKKIGKIFVIGNNKVETEDLIASFINNRPKQKLDVFKDIFFDVLSLNIFYTFFEPFNLEKISNFFKKKFILKSTKIDYSKIIEDKKSIFNTLKKNGFINSKINNFEIYEDKDQDYVNILIDITENEKFKVGEINFIGNQIYSDSFLQNYLGIKEGDFYDPSFLKDKLSNINVEKSLASLYYDNGYLTYSAEIIERRVSKNTVDLDIVISENDKYKIGNVTIEGNTITKQNVIFRNLVLFSGDYFSASALMRSLRNLSVLQLFDLSELKPQTSIDPENKLVEIVFKVKESPNLGTMFTLSFEEKRLVYGLKLSTNNFSFLNLFKGKIPLGSAQDISLHSTFDHKSNHKHSFSISDQILSEKYPYSLSFSAFFAKSKVYKTSKDLDYSTVIDSKKYLGNKIIWGTSFGIGKKIDFIDYTFYKINFNFSQNNYIGKYSLFDENENIKGVLKNIYFDFIVSRDSTDNMIFPTEGTVTSIFFTLTPPYSLFSEKNIFKKNIEINKLLYKEYFQVFLDYSFFKKIYQKLVFNFKTNFGILGSFQKDIGPFQRFSFGGTDSDELNALLLGDHISMRGYEDGTLTPKDGNLNYKGGVIFQKFVFELKYPFIESNLLHLSMHAFFESGNCWSKYKNFNIFNLKGSLGFGFRAFIGLILNSIISIDFGCPLNRLGKQNSFIPQFSFGFGNR
jgi:outer membrane protein insertion porin family